MALIESLNPSSQESDSRKVGVTDFWLLGLRVLVAWSMIYFQAWQQAVSAWGFVWEKKPWGLADEFVALGMPQPTVFSVTLVFFLMVCSFGILIGFLTRINSLVLFIALAFVLLAQLDDNLSATLNPQSLLLYMGMALILTLAGGGLLSFDALLTRRRRQKQARMF